MACVQKRVAGCSSWARLAWPCRSAGYFVLRDLNFFNYSEIAISVGSLSTLEAPKKHPAANRSGRHERVRKRRICVMAIPNAQP